MNYRDTFLLLGLCLGSLVAQAQDDTHFWQNYNWQFYATDTYNLNLHVINRNRDDAGEAFAYFVGPTIRASLNKYVGIGAAARKFYFKRSDGWTRGLLSEAEVTFKYKMGRVNIANRNRYEYYFNDSGKDFQFYRAHLQFSLPLPGRLKKISINNEWFHDDRIHDIPFNRLVPIALSFQLTPKVGCTTYYMWEHVRSGPKDNHILGLALSF